MSEKLGSILVERGLISNEQLEKALTIQRTGDIEKGIAVGEHLGNILILQGLVDPRDIALVCCEQFGNVNYIIVDGFPVDPVMAGMLGMELAVKYKLLPLVRLNHDHALFLVEDDLFVNIWQNLAGIVHVRHVDYICDPKGGIAEYIEACYEALASRKIRMV